MAQLYLFLGMVQMEGAGDWVLRVHGATNQVFQPEEEVVLVFSPEHVTVIPR